MHLNKKQWLSEQLQLIHNNSCESLAGLLAELLESIDIVVLGLDIDFSLRYCNPLAKQLLGLSETSIDKPLQTLASILTDEELLTDITTLQQTQTPLLKKRISLTDEHVLLRYLIALRKNNDATGFVLCYRNLSDLKSDLDGFDWATPHAESKTKQEHLSKMPEYLQMSESSEDLAIRNKELRDFTYIVSHDMRSPLINIKGFAGEIRYELEEISSVFESLLQSTLTQTQQEHVRAVLSETLPEAISFIEASVNKMERQINAILNLSRLGRQEILFQQISINEIISDIIKSLAHQIEEKQVQINLTELPDVISDRAALELILDNLLENAVKYLVDGRPSLIKIYAEYKASEVIIHIQDNGRGIAQQDMQKIFQLFRRAGSSNTPGEGMGLAYAQTLARRLGGNIDCDSILGQGSTFHLTLSQQTPSA